MRRILVTNDDGVHAPGIAALAAALSDLGEVTVVAPAHEASAVGHALTLARPLRLEEIRPHVFSVDGTPTDCVNVAITHVLKGTPDLIVSGINTGYNIGDDVTYSGTVAGALEGALLNQLDIHAVFGEKEADVTGARAERMVEKNRHREVFNPVTRKLEQPERGLGDLQKHRCGLTNGLRSGKSTRNPPVLRSF